MRMSPSTAGALIIALTWPAPAAAREEGWALLADTTFTVNTTDDPGDGICDAAHCSLREAIEAANANAGTDTIAFDIDGIAPHTIQPAVPLPAISDPLVIDGTTEPDFTIRPVVDLDGTAAGAGATGLRITAGASTVRGLVIRNFADGIRLEITGGNIVEGNIIGADFRALDCEGNSGVGIWIDSPDNTIGGTAQTAPNIVVCSGADGIHIAGGTGNVIKGNFVGTDDTRAEALPNARDGVRIDDSSDNAVGGAGPLDGNYLFFNGAAGISIRGAGSTDNLVAGNTITENGGDGVELPDAGAGNRIAENSIDGTGGLGIDLGADGVTPNDLGDADTGPNDLQNYPELMAAIPLVGQVYLQGALNSRPNTSYDLEFFLGGACNASGHGEGLELIEPSAVTTNGAGEAPFQLTLIEDVLPGDVLSATATDPDGNTSEFSACVVATTFTLALSPDSVVVTRGSEAKYAVDLTAVGGDFDLPIQLDCSDLPALTECSFAPATVTPGASARSILTVTTTAPSGSIAANAAGTGVGASRAGLVLLAVAVAGLTAFRLRRPETQPWHIRRGRVAPRYGLAVIAGAFVCLGLALFTGCGDDDGTGPTDGGTPTGRHEFMVTATAGPVERSETGLLVVR
jgi:CSLREA domain-containing protein